MQKLKRDEAVHKEGLHGLKPRKQKGGKGDSHRDSAAGVSNVSSPVTFVLCLFPDCFWW